MHTQACMVRHNCLQIYTPLGRLLARSPWQRHPQVSHGVQCDERLSTMARVDSSSNHLDKLVESSLQHFIAVATIRGKY